MKAFEIIGWVFDGALYHEGCEPEAALGEDECPIFASTDLEPLDYCDHCLHKFIAEHPGKSASEWGTHVYLDEDRACDFIRAEREAREGAGADE
jgi:hypothetical protein